MQTPSESIEVPSAPAFQRREWAVQRTGRRVLAGVLVAAVLGLFGGGPAARARASAAGVQVEWDRFARSVGHVVMHVAAQGDMVSVRLHGFTEPGDRVTWTPKPVDEAAGDGGYQVMFDARDAATIDLRWQPHRPGLHQGTITVNDESFEIWSFVYP